MYYLLLINQTFDLNVFGASCCVQMLLSCFCSKYHYTVGRYQVCVPRVIFLLLCSLNIKNWATTRYIIAAIFFICTCSSKWNGYLGGNIFMGNWFFVHHSRIRSMKQVQAKINKFWFIWISMIPQKQFSIEYAYMHYSVTSKIHLNR